MEFTLYDKTKLKMAEKLLNHLKEIPKPNKTKQQQSTQTQICQDMKDELNRLKFPEDNGSSSEASSESSGGPEDLMDIVSKHEAATVIQKFWKKKLAKESEAPSNKSF